MMNNKQGGDLPGVNNINRETYQDEQQTGRRPTRMNNMNREESSQDEQHKQGGILP